MTGLSSYSNQVSQVKSKIVTVGKLLTFTTLKKTAYKPDGAAYHRLATMWSSRIFEAKEKDAFKNIFMGDEMMTIDVQFEIL